MIVALHPKFDYRPLWKKATPDAPWTPDIDEATGRQKVDRVPLATTHQIFWPADSTVSSIAQDTWFSLTQSFDITGHYWFNGTSYDAGGVPNGAPLLKDGPIANVRDLEWSTLMPHGTRKVTVKLDPVDETMYATFEVKAKG